MFYAKFMPCLCHVYAMCKPAGFAAGFVLLAERAVTCNYICMARSRHAFTFSLSLSSFSFVSLSFLSHIKARVRE